MARQPRKFEAKPATREAVPLLIGLGGPPGSGKTYSALLLASGIAAHRGGPVVLIDTERNRALKYAPPAGKKANGVDHFEFLHVPFSPPFASLDFRDAVMEQRKHKPSCIIIDSFSDEHEGAGGMLDFHETELDRMAGTDWSKRERVGQAAWIKPKADRLEMMGELFQVLTPILFTYRCREKVKQVKDDRGKMAPTNIGWTPIAPPEIIHNMDLFALLPIKSDGVPMWKGNTAYEDFSIKLPRQFQGLFPDGKPIDQQMGQAMSIWALGDVKPAVAGTPATKEAAPAEAPRPQEPKAAPSVEEPKPTAESATPASTSSPTETSSPENTSAPSSDGEKADLGPQEPSSTSEEAAKPRDPETPSAAENTTKETAFHDYARAVAEANDWPQIDHALGALRKTADWTSAQKPQQEMARRIAFTRLKELTDAGYKFSVTTDMQAWRCYISWETKQATLLERRSLVAQTPAWMALDTPSKIAMDKAFDARIMVLKAEQGEAT